MQRINPTKKELEIFARNLIEAVPKVKGEDVGPDDFSYYACRDIQSFIENPLDQSHLIFVISTKRWYIEDDYFTSQMAIYENAIKAYVRAILDKEKDGIELPQEELKVSFIVTDTLQAYNALGRNAKRYEIDESDNRQCEKIFPSIVERLKLSKESSGWRDRSEQAISRLLNAGTVRVNGQDKVKVKVSAKFIYWKEKQHLLNSPQFKTMLGFLEENFKEGYREFAASVNAQKGKRLKGRTKKQFEYDLDKLEAASICDIRYMLEECILFFWKLYHENAPLGEHKTFIAYPGKFKTVYEHAYRLLVARYGDSWIKELDLASLEMVIPEQIDTKNDKDLDEFENAFCGNLQQNADLDKARDERLKTLEDLQMRLTEKANAALQQARAEDQREIHRVANLFSNEQEQRQQVERVAAVEKQERYRAELAILNNIGTKFDEHQVKINDAHAGKWDRNDPYGSVQIILGHRVNKAADSEGAGVKFKLFVKRATKWHSSANKAALKDILRRISKDDSPDVLLSKLITGRLLLDSKDSSYRRLLYCMYHLKNDHAVNVDAIKQNPQQYFNKHLQSYQVSC